MDRLQVALKAHLRKKPKRGRPRRHRDQGRLFRPKYRDKRTGEWKEFSTWWIQYNHRGLTHRESAKTRNKTEAVKLLTLRLAHLREGRPSGSAVDRVTFGDLTSMLLNDYRVNRRRSIARVELAVRHLRRFRPTPSSILRPGQGG